MHTAELCIFKLILLSAVLLATCAGFVKVLLHVHIDAYATVFFFFFLPSCSQLIIKTLVRVAAILNSTQLTQTELIRVVTIGFII